MQNRIFSGDSRPELLHISRQLADIQRELKSVRIVLDKLGIIPLEQSYRPEFFHSLESN